MRHIGELLDEAGLRARQRQGDRHRLHCICPGCGNYVELRDRVLHGQTSALRFFGSICACGRGVDAQVEREPASEAKE